MPAYAMARKQLEPHSTLVRTLCGCLEAHQSHRCTVRNSHSRQSSANKGVSESESGDRGGTRGRTQEGQKAVPGAQTLESTAASWSIGPMSLACTTYPDSQKRKAVSPNSDTRQGYGCKAHKITPTAVHHAPGTQPAAEERCGSPERAPGLVSGTAAAAAGHGQRSAPAQKQPCRSGPMMKTLASFRKGRRWHETPLGHLSGRRLAEALRTCNQPSDQHH